jgi:hypothetical protein
MEYFPPLFHGLIEILIQLNVFMIHVIEVILLFAWMYSLHLISPIFCSVSMLSDLNSLRVVNMFSEN